ncbi:hypothetical protein B0T17DRAFT_151163 [Bombardia bombarda]|uniref:Uncharacterized protein n=1 Tax=Bombardia bombarda TaxID=252184 RepID=A0AA39X6T3_9PEZI|nr:hypothetical protein B0T17DRAFT_151163 [Bombardia bombarda]
MTHRNDRVTRAGGTLMLSLPTWKDTGKHACMAHAVCSAVISQGQAHHHPHPRPYRQLSPPTPSPDDGLPARELVPARLQFLHVVRIPVNLPRARRPPTRTLLKLPR